MTIKIDQYTDPFTYHIYHQIDANVRATLTPTQVTAIETAIRASRPYQKHPIDIRGVFPFYFIRFYFVILMGRDKRTQTRNKEDLRRRKAALGSALISVYVTISIISPLILVVLYAVKTMIGIDLVEGIHLSDLLGGW